MWGFATHATRNDMQATVCKLFPKRLKRQGGCRSTGKGNHERFGACIRPLIRKDVVSRSGQGPGRLESGLLKGLTVIRKGWVVV